jgi:hypothetical protein
VSFSDRYQKLLDLTGSREKPLPLQYETVSVNKAGGGKRGPLPPPAFAEVRRVGSLSVKASPAAASKTTFAKLTANPAFNSGTTLARISHSAK